MNKISKYTLRDIKHLSLEELDDAIKIQKILLLSMAYFHYSMSILHSDIVKIGNPTYEEAERNADFFNWIFGTDSTPSVFLHDENDMAEKSLEDYEEYTICVKALEVLKCDKGAVSAFCKAIENSYVKGLGHYSMKMKLDYRFYVEALLAYMGGCISYEELKRAFVETSIIKKECTPLNKIQVLRFYRDMLSAYNFFVELSEKRERRAAV